MKIKGIQKTVNKCFIMFSQILVYSEILSLYAAVRHVYRDIMVLSQQWGDFARKESSLYDSILASKMQVVETTQETISLREKKIKMFQTDVITVFSIMAELDVSCSKEYLGEHLVQEKHLLVMTPFLRALTNGVYFQLGNK